MMFMMLVVVDVAYMHIISHRPNSRMQSERLLTRPIEIWKTGYILALSTYLSLEGRWLAQLIKNVLLVIHSIFTAFRGRFGILCRCITDI